jgi:hypothetical protein
MITRSALFHEEARTAFTIRQMMNDASMQRTAAVYGTGAAVANFHSGQTITKPAPAHTDASARTLEKVMKDRLNEFLISAVMVFSVLKKTGFCIEQKPVCVQKQSEDYSSAIADAGHSEAHVPQLMHFDESILRFPLSSEIALTGQSGSHVPQSTHLSASILYAI